jgi:hypothetical protein
MLFYEFFSIGNHYYRLKYVHVSIDCYTKRLKYQRLWTFEVVIIGCAQVEFKILDIDKG